MERIGIGIERGIEEGECYAGGERLQWNTFRGEGERDGRAYEESLRASSGMRGPVGVDS